MLQLGGVETVGQSPDITRERRGHFDGASDLPSLFGHRRLDKLLDGLETQQEHGQLLTNVVVKFLRQPSALEFLGLDQSLIQRGKRIFGQLAFGNVDGSADVTRERTVRIM